MKRAEIVDGLVLEGEDWRVLTLPVDLPVMNVS